MAALGRTSRRGTTEGEHGEPREPPVSDVVDTISNPMLSRLLRSPLHPLASDSTSPSTLSGSKTGNEYTTPVGHWVKDDRLSDSASGDIWIRANGALTLDERDLV